MSAIMTACLEYPLVSSSILIFFQLFLILFKSDSTESILFLLFILFASTI